MTKVIFKCREFFKHGHGMYDDVADELYLDSSADEKELERTLEHELVHVQLRKHRSLNILYDIITNPHFYPVVFIICLAAIVYPLQTSSVYQQLLKCEGACRDTYNISKLNLTFNSTAVGNIT